MDSQPSSSAYNKRTVPSSSNSNKHDGDKEEEEAGFKEDMKKFMKNYSYILVVIVLVAPLFPVVLIIVRAALRPGYVFCDSSDNPCPNGLTIAISDPAMIGIAMALYLITFICSLMILCSSGSWMHHAFRNKMISISVLYIIIWSIIQLFTPFSFRGYVVPYSKVQPFLFEITPITSTSASINITNYFNPDYYQDSQHVMLQVFEIPKDSGQTTPHKLSPILNPVYADSSWSQTSVLTTDFTLQKDVDNLEVGRSYIWILWPSKKHDNSAYQDSNYVTPLNANNSDIYHGKLPLSQTYVDLRGYYVCKWEGEESGCIS